MAKCKLVTYENGDFYGVRFNCPGCAEQRYEAGDDHYVRGWVVLPVKWTPPGMRRSPHINEDHCWGFNGDLLVPTFTPSVLTQWDQWMGDGVPKKHHVCHSFVTNGRIQFLGDCTHSLKGQTVDVPDIEETSEG